MPRFLTTLSLIAALSAGSAVMAQDTTPKPEDSTGDTAAAASDSTAETTANEPGSDLSMGQDTAPAIPQPYFGDEHGDWKLQCFPVEGQDDPCNLYQLLKDEQGTEVAEVAIFRLPAGGQAVAGATITVSPRRSNSSSMKIANFSASSTGSLVTV